MENVNRKLKNWFFSSRIYKISENEKTKRDSKEDNIEIHANMLHEIDEIKELFKLDFNSETLIIVDEGIQTTEIEVDTKPVEENCEEVKNYIKLKEITVKKV